MNYVNVRGHCSHHISQRERERGRDWTVVTPIAPGHCNLIIILPGQPNVFLPSPVKIYPTFILPSQLTAHSITPGRSRQINQPEIDILYGQSLPVVNI